MNDYRIATKVERNRDGEITGATMYFVTREVNEQQLDLTPGDNVFPVIFFDYGANRSMAIYGRDGSTLFADDDIVEGNDEEITAAIAKSFGVTEDKVIELNYRSAQTVKLVGIARATGLPLPFVQQAMGITDPSREIPVTEESQS